MITFERTDLDQVPWAEWNRFEDRMIFQTLPWIRFITSTQAAEPVVATIKQDGRVSGCFTGFIVRKMRLKLLVSPFNGWTTAYMGFNLLPGISRREVLKAFSEFAFGELSCRFFQMADRHLQDTDFKNLPYVAQYYPNLEIDLALSEETLFANMDSACRRCIRKAEKSNISIEEASDEGFVNDYYEQLKEVFSKHSLVPTYSIERVRKLVKFLHPSGNLLLLRARDPDGRCIATGIFPGLNRYMHFWGGASWRKFQILRPNEVMMWHAMKYWKARGATTFDMGGWAPYKKKYGAREIHGTLLMASRPEFLMPMRNLAHRSWRKYHKGISRLTLWRNHAATESTNP